MIEFNLENITLKLTDEMLNKIKSLKQVDNERAGVLMGQLYPKSNTVLLTHIIECDYLEQSKYAVEVNNILLNDEINRIWNEDNTITYIGDWHTHPEDNPIISFTDINTIKDKFINGKITQNFLIDIIIGYESNFIEAFDGQLFHKVKII